MIKNFSGKTFVAFIDISGFKAMLNEDKNQATGALDKFYQIGYNVLQGYQNEVNGIFISDCGILFVVEPISIERQLETLLNVVKKINKKMLAEDFMLTTNIAYGDFSYQDRIEFTGITKNLLYGNAYLSAYLDSNAKPKIEPGFCRILKENIDNTSFLDTNEFLKRKKQHYYFYWNVDTPEQIESFEQAYKNSRFRGALQALKNQL